jgi:tetratricopeptide (TPR) repeat protein
MPGWWDWRATPNLARQRTPLILIVKQRGGEPMDDPLGDAERLLAEGDDLADAGEDAEALRRYRAAWSALPEPREEQEPAIRIQAAIADCHFHLGDWESCRQAVQHAFRCGAEPDNPFLRLRIGQSLYELGDEREAANWLVLAFLSEGRSLFQEDDPKYLEFFRDRLQSPPGGWPKGW